MFNLKTQAERRREVALQTRLSLTLERPFAASLRAEIRRTTKKAAGDVRHTHDVGGAINAHKHALRAIFVRHYRTISRAFFNRAIDAMGKSVRVRERKAPPALTAVVLADDPASDGSAIDDAAAAYDELWDDLATSMAARIDGIADTTRDQIQARISRGLADGDSWDDIASDVEALGVDSERAAIIAATEAHTVAMESLHAAAGSLGIALTKRWVAVHDDRTRPDHAEADEQVVDYDDDFIVGDSSLTKPGDIDGPPEQVINCRCGMTYAEKEE